MLCGPRGTELVENHGRSWKGEVSGLSSGASEEAEGRGLGLRGWGRAAGLGCRGTEGADSSLATSRT